jgi:hypothetical protein
VGQAKANTSMVAAKSSGKGAVGVVGPVKQSSVQDGSNAIEHGSNVLFSIMQVGLSCSKYAPTEHWRTFLEAKRGHAPPPTATKIYIIVLSIYKF